MDSDDIFGIFLLIIIGIGIFFVISIGHSLLTAESEVIVGEVVNVDFFDDYMRVEFDTGDVFNIDFNSGIDNEIDLTVNSVMRVELCKFDIWFIPNNNDVWSIREIIKVPDGDV